MLKEVWVLMFTSKLYSAVKVLSEVYLETQFLSITIYLVNGGIFLFVFHEVQMTLFQLDLILGCYWIGFDAIIGEWSVWLVLTS